MREVNLDRLRELAGYLKNAVRQLREMGQSSRDAFLKAPRTVTSIGQYLKAELAVQAGRAGSRTFRVPSAAIVLGSACGDPVLY